MGQRPIVGEQQQSGGVLIQPPHRKQPSLLQLGREQVQHRGLIFVLGGGEQPRRLVEHHIDKGGAVHLRPVHRKANGGGVRFLLRLLDSPPVRQHPALPDQLLHFLPAPPPGGAEQLVDALHALSPIIHIPRPLRIG